MPLLSRTSLYCLQSDWLVFTRRQPTRDIITGSYFMFTRDVFARNWSVFMFHTWRHVKAMFWDSVLLTARKVITECRRIEKFWAQRMRSCEHTHNSQRVHVSLKALTATVCGFCQMGLYRFWALMGFTVCIRVNDVYLYSKSYSEINLNTFYTLWWICFHWINHHLEMRFCED